MSTPSHPTDDPSAPPWATTHTLPYAATSSPQPEAAAAAAPSDRPVPQGVAPPATAPALNPPLWSGRKTAIAAALAIGISSAAAAGAAAALPSGSAARDQGQFQQGGFGPGGQGRRFGPGGQSSQGQQLPSQQLPGQPAPANPAPVAP